MRRLLLSVLYSVLMMGTSLAVEVVLGFGKLTHDEQIINLLNKCNSKIRAFWYETPYGTGGSAARSDWYEPEKFFTMMRKQILEGYRDAYFSRIISLKIIIDNNLLTKEDLQRYPKLFKFVKGLVNVYYQRSKGFQYIKNGEPIVYAVLVNTNNVNCLESSKIVKEISVNYFPLFNAFLKYVPYYFRPKQYSKYYFFPEVKNASPEKLYMMIDKAVKGVSNDPEFINYYKFYIKAGFYKTKFEFLKHQIEKSKNPSFNPAPTYFPNRGTIFYTGTNVEGLFYRMYSRYKPS